MSRAELEAARKMMRDGDYNGARIVLRGETNPIALEWLERMEKAEQKARHQRYLMSRRMRLRAFLHKWFGWEFGHRRK